MLRPGGRFAISDIVLREPLPAALRENEELWAAAWTECFSGALDQDEYRRKLTAAGFVGVEVEPTRTFGREDVRGFLTDHGIDDDELVTSLDGKAMSAFVRAVKP